MIAILDLPREIIIKIIKHVLIQDIGNNIENISLVCKQFLCCISDESIYKLLCQIIWGNLKYLEDMQEKYKWNYLYRFIPHPKYNGTYTSISNTSEQNKIRCIKFYSPTKTTVYNYIGPVKYAIHCQNKHYIDFDITKSILKTSFDIMEGFYIGNKQNNKLLVTLYRNNDLNSLLINADKRFILAFFKQFSQVVDYKMVQNFEVHSVSHIGKFIKFEIEKDEKDIPNNKLIYEKQDTIYKNTNKNDRVCRRSRLKPDFQPFYYTKSDFEILVTHFESPPL